MGELVGEEVGLGELVGVVGEAFFADAVVGGLAVLEAFAAGDVREGEEEVVDVVVVRLVGGAGLADEVVESRRGAAGRSWSLPGVGDDVDVVLGRDLGGEGELVEVLAGDDGGVFKLFDVGCGEVGDAACWGVGIVARRLGVSAVPMPQPAGTLTRGLDGDVFDGSVGGIEEELLPLEDGELCA